MSTNEGEERIRTERPMRTRIIVYGVVLLAVFLLGLIPMWISGRGRAAELYAARHDLRLCRLEKSLLSAAVESRRGEYESARSAASNFFTSLREQVDLASESSDLAPAQKENLKPLLNERDDLITLLARSDPASADRLAQLYVSFKNGMGSAQP
jgi:hypothetical protein